MVKKFPSSNKSKSGSVITGIIILLVLIGVAVGLYFLITRVFMTPAVGATGAAAGATGAAAGATGAAAGATGAAAGATGAASTTGATGSTSTDAGASSGATGTTTVPETIKPVPKTVPVYKETKNGFNNFSTRSKEIAAADGWIQEAKAEFKAFPTQEPNTIPVWLEQTSNGKYGNHWSTRPVGDANQWGWNQTSVAWYAYPTQQIGTVPVFLETPKTAQHSKYNLSTRTKEEADASGWTQLSTAFYAYPATYEGFESVKSRSSLDMPLCSRNGDMLLLSNYTTCYKF